MFVVARELQRRKFNLWPGECRRTTLLSTVIGKSAGESCSDPFAHDRPIEVVAR